MTIDDVDVRFFPSDEVSSEEGRDWRRIIASAVADAPGCASLAFMRVESAWLLLGLYWRGTGDAWAVEDARAALPLRARAIDALRAAGKQIVAN